MFRTFFDYLRRFFGGTSSIAKQESPSQPSDREPPESEEIADLKFSPAERSIFDSVPQSPASHSLGITSEEKNAGENLPEERSLMEIPGFETGNRRDFDDSSGSGPVPLSPKGKAERPEPSFSRKEFAELVISKAREVKEDVQFTYDEKEYSLRVHSRERQIVYLHNAYLEYNRSSEQDRPYVLKKWLRHLLFLKTVPEDFEDVEPDLLPALRTRSYFELTRLRFAGQDREMPRFPYQDIGEFFGLSVSYDMHDSIVMISEKHLEDWGITFYEAMEIAMRNLQQRECVFTCLRLEDRLRVYLASAGDSFDGTRLVLTEPIRNLDVLGDTVAMVLSTDSLMITGSEDELGLGFFYSQAMEAHQRPHAIPPFLLKLEGEDWVPWLPPQTDRLHLPFKKYQVYAAGSDYAEQQDILENLHKKNGKAIHVSRFFVAQHEKSERLFTYTVWSGGEMDILLPKTDYIAFTENESSRPIMIPWDIACEVVGYLMEIRIEYPVRYFICTFPTRRELAEMLRRTGGKNPFTQPREKTP